MNTLKEILQIIREIVAEKVRSLPASARIYIFIGICAIVVLLYVVVAWRASSHFARDYEAYAKLAEAHLNAAYIPGSPQNQVRQELNQMLSDILTKKLSADERLELAKKGLELELESEKQIADITATGDATDVAIAKMQVDMLGAYSQSQRAREIVALAKERASIISDIRAYSYRANYEVLQIFNRIIADKGRLSDSYVLELNAAVPVLEEQFDKRTQLYTRLQALAEDIKHEAEGL